MDRHERGGEAIARVLKDDAALPNNRRPHEDIMLGQRLLHGGGVVLPVGRAARNIGE
jgi:hypothetical protein